MKQLFIVVAGAVLGISGVAIAGDCDGLYPGKAITLKNHGAGILFGMSTIPAIIVGLDKSSRLVSIKLTETNRDQETSCYQLKQEIVNR
ncbi:MAG: hypothetical protein HQL07_00700 [Nitrospirae bacterium]|nr:hypothetical protein [Magnetococcales bacterium]